MGGNDVGIPSRRLRTIELFAGAGGGILGSEILGHRTVAAVEIDPYCRRVLLERQHDGSLPDRFGVWDDVRTFDGRPWAGLDADGFPRCDVIKGGFPCTDISAANSKGAGIEGAKSGLWREMARIIREVRPRFVFLENSPLLVRRGLAVVLGDLAALRYDARWCVLGAHHVGAPHKRDRIWVLATNADRDAVRDDEQRSTRGRVDVQNSGDAKSSNDGEKELMAAHLANAGCRRLGPKEAGKVEFARGTEIVGTGSADRTGRRNSGESDGGVVGFAANADTDVSDPMRDGLQDRFSRGATSATDGRSRYGRYPGWWDAEPDVGRVVNGLAAGMDGNQAPHRRQRLRALGNGQVPSVASLAWIKLGGPT